MKSILIMGANPETVSLVQKARQMGLYTYVTDYNPEAYAKRFADHPLNIDASDVDALVEVIQSEKIDAVLVGVAEALLPAYCEVCRRVNKPCFVQEELLEIFLKKDKFKNTCRRYGVPVVDEYEVNCSDAIDFPVVVKPVDSCSSKGISVCMTQEDLPEAIEKALGFSRSGKYIIERYMTGEEVVIYYAICNGVPTLVAVCDRYTNKEQQGVAQLPTAYLFPSRHLQSYMEKTDESVRAMLTGLGVQNGTLFLQAFVGDDGIVRIYEPGFRLNGAQEHILVSEATGIDAKELLINYALYGDMHGDCIQKNAAPGFHGLWGCKLSPLVETGRIAKLAGLDEIARMEGVISVNPSYVEGEVVTGAGTLKQIVCRFYIMAETKEMLKRRIDRVYETFVVENDAGKSMLMTPFSTDLIDDMYG